MRLEDYGAIVALLGKDGSPLGVQGLVHKKELSWDVVMTVDDVVKLGEQRCVRLTPAVHQLLSFDQI